MGAKSLVSRLFGTRRKFASDLEALSDDELRSLMRHEAHRIEKSVYNGIKEKKRAIYEGKRDRLREILAILERRGAPLDEPTLVWARRIGDAFDSLEEDFIRPGSTEARPWSPDQGDELLRLFASRRSCRVWADEQPSEEELLVVARQMIDAARWAPTSGNRQPWRFMILTKAEDKELLRGLKEQHCIGAPLLVFVAMDKRVYGFLGDDERLLYIDAGAAIMQMVLLAHRVGLGTCWNHFADDLIASRPANEAAYSRFVRELGLPQHLEPVAIVAIGRPAFVPPTPERMDPTSLEFVPPKK